MTDQEKIAMLRKALKDILEYSGSTVLGHDKFRITILGNGQMALAATAPGAAPTDGAMFEEWLEDAAKRGSVFGPETTRFIKIGWDAARSKCDEEAIK